MRTQAERRRHGCVHARARSGEDGERHTGHCSRSLPSCVTAARCRRRSLPTKGSPDVAARLRAASRLRVEAELSRDAWTRAAARRWREQQRQCLDACTSAQNTRSRSWFRFSAQSWFRFCSSNYFLSEKYPLEGEHSSLRSTRGPTAAPPHVHAPPPAACLLPPTTSSLLPRPGCGSLLVPRSDTSCT